MVNLHIVLRTSGELLACLPWLREAEAEAAALGDLSASPFFENAWGQLHLWSGEFELAERRFRAGLDSSDAPAARVTIGLNLGEALLAQGRLLDAIEAIREAEREALVGSAWSKLPEVYRLLGRVLAAAGNPDAFVLFERALEIGHDRPGPVLERALTLQAYAAAERQRGERNTSEELMSQARELYQTLGIQHVRHPWTDVYAGPAGPGSSNGSSDPPESSARNTKDERIDDGESDD